MSEDIEITGSIKYVPVDPIWSYKFPEPLGDITGKTDMEILFNAISKLCELNNPSHK